jgi:hemolysin D
LDSSPNDPRRSLEEVGLSDFSRLRRAPQVGFACLAKETLLRNWILVDGRHEQICAGMRVSAEIKTGDRQVIDYLLSPVMQAVKEAGRER